MTKTSVCQEPAMYWPLFKALHLYYFAWPPKTPYEVGSIILLILLMMELRSELTRDHTNSKL